jgi:ketosteroid isomerase-like protein
MAQNTAERFMKGLQEMEARKDPTLLAAIFAEGAELSNAARATTFRGRDGAKEFWREYLSVFDHVHSEFTRVIEQGPRAALEWRSEAVLTSGEPITYTGVSLIEVSDGLVTRFRTYYDATPFLPPRAAATDAGVPPGI